ncbi:glycosyltransferase [Motiliproteus coralliicola]|uniref:Glycosyltransferase n=1 Tax=Motiliproteus coralliicola TaxID=2283196 RepID=A0A369WU01_9GAMM|nr:glycosyltransferase family 4 protein [Motiliproteus coralliicola]RDE22985.1 glycosyltransferase [Motiliproteus coralliicola]
MSEPLRVLFPEASATFGGSQVSTLDLVEHLSRESLPIEVSVALQSDTPFYRYYKQRQLASRHHLLGRRGYPGGRHLLWICRYLWRACGLLRRERIDIVHCTNETLLLWLLPCVLCRTKLIWNLRVEVGTGWKILLRKWFYLSVCDEVIAVSQAALGSLNRPGGSIKPRLSMIPNFAPERLINSVAIIEPRPADEVLNIGFVGRLDDPLKDPARAFRIIAGLLQRGVSLRFHLFGHQNESIRRQLLASFPSAYHDRVVFHGWQNLEETYPKIDLLLMTTLTEGFPRVVMEAALFGVPAVSTSVGGVPEAIAHEVSGYCFTEDSEAVDVVARLATNRQLLNGWGAAAKQRYLNELSWKEVVPRYLKTYQRLLSRG